VLEGIGERSIFEGIRQIQLSIASKKYTKQTCANTTIYYLIRKFYSVCMVVITNLINLQKAINKFNSITKKLIINPYAI
jgi:hypothetical protein